MVHGELLTKVLPHSIMWFKESYWRKCYPYWIVWLMKLLYYPIQICGSWRVTDESITPFKYVVHGELRKWIVWFMKVLPHSIMWFVENYWRKCYPIQLYGSGELLTKVLPLLNYVVHGELLTKVLLHSCMWFVESYWRKCYSIQLCGSWRVTDESGKFRKNVLSHSIVWFMESFIQFRYVVHGIFYPIQLCGSWNILSNSMVWFMESFIQFRYEVHGTFHLVQLCGSWNILSNSMVLFMESFIQFRYVVHGTFCPIQLCFIGSYGRRFYPIQLWVSWWSYGHYIVCPLIIMYKVSIILNIWDF